MTDILERFTILPVDDSYRLQLTLTDGTTVSVDASFEQLDQMGEEIDRQLDADEELPLPKL